MDTQTVEIIGRNYLTSQLLAAGLEVAVPIRDRGVDLIAYADLDSESGRFSARPIQLKARMGSAFALNRKYERFPDLLYAYVMGLADPLSVIVYAFSTAQATRIAEEMGWTKTETWRKGSYSTPRVSAKLSSLLAPHTMNAELWWKLITAP